jgi:hypothetical protein
MPVLAVGEDRGAEPDRTILDHLQRVVLLASDDHGNAALDDARLLGGDPRERVAEELLMVHVDRRDDREARGFSTTFVASSRPPSPTSSRVMSAGSRRMRQKAAAVVISK